MRFVLILAFVSITALAGPMKDSKEELTNSLISLKSPPTEEPPAQRQKRSETNKVVGKEDDISGVALVLSQYIKDTGDLDGVMDFLRTMVSSGKLSEADGLSYIARVINNLETIKTPYNHHEVEPAQALRHLIQEENEAREDQEDKIEKINQEQQDLNKSKQEIELKIKNLEQQKSEEQDLIKKKQLVSNLMKQVEDGEKDNETILTINKLLEEEKNKERISKHLYMHVKEALIQTAVENISKMTKTETGVSGKH